MGMWLWGAAVLLVGGALAFQTVEEQLCFDKVLEAVLDEDEQSGSLCQSLSLVFSSPETELFG
mgnify:CR=1 FL=1